MSNPCHIDTGTRGVVEIQSVLVSTSRKEPRRREHNYIRFSYIRFSLATSRIHMPATSHIHMPATSHIHTYMPATSHIHVGGFTYTYEGDFTFKYGGDFTLTYGRSAASKLSLMHLKVIDFSVSTRFGSTVCPNGMGDKCCFVCRLSFRWNAKTKENKCTYDSTARRNLLSSWDSILDELDLRIRVCISLKTNMYDTPKSTQHEKHFCKNLHPSGSSTGHTPAQCPVKSKE